MSERTCEACPGVLPEGRNLCPDCGRLNRGGGAWTPPARRPASLAPAPTRVVTAEPLPERAVPSVPRPGIPGELRSIKTTLVTWAALIVVAAAVCGVAYAITMSTR